MLGVILAIALPGVARGDRCRDFPGSDRLSRGIVDCPVEVERGVERSKLDWRRNPAAGRDQRTRTMPPALPGPGGNGATFGPMVQPPTREGPMGIADLALVPDGKGGYRGQRPGFEFDIERDGTIHFKDRPPVELAGFGLGLGMIVLAATFDLTDMLMRAAGMDPYSHDKGRVAELTRGMRMDMRAAERPRRIAAALAQLPADLERLWGRRDLAGAARRELLFQLWDDLLEGPAAGTEEAAAARRARAEILQFVRRRLPEGSAEAFTAPELARLNARRRSGAPFAPYDR